MPTHDPDATLAALARIREASLTLRAFAAVRDDESVMCTRWFLRENKAVFIAASSSLIRTETAGWL
jgi:hypothetical protein